MPVRTDIRKILVIGSGPIQIGQGCEFDYSGTQACLALKDLGFEVSLVNSNPATIMTDSSTAHRVYIEPLTVECLAEVLERERPDALLPTVGGQVALNLFLELEEQGHLARLGIRTLGVSSKTVILTEDRRAFRNLLEELGLEVIRGDVAHSAESAYEIANTLNYPLVVRTSFTLGGAGGGVVANPEQLAMLVDRVFKQNKNAQMVIEESIAGWKEYELEVMRDAAGTFVVVCGVENVNPMGVHTGDSITCAPCMTLTDREYQHLRNTAKQIFEKVGMETGGANIQFAVHPQTGRMIVVEMNPRVSRSSALVSKATGYPIARLAAQIAAGLTLAELKNEITQSTSAAFEPSIDYVVVKIPRWDFAKYKGASDELGVQMKSVGEVLAFGRTFRDAFQKAWRSLELGYEGWPDLGQTPEFLAALRAADPYARSTAEPLNKDTILNALGAPTPALFPALKSAMQCGFEIDELHERTGISHWFLSQLAQLVELEQRLAHPEFADSDLIKAKQDGFTQKGVAALSGLPVGEINLRTERLGLKPTFKMVDSCAGEFEAHTPYYYKTFEQQDENIPSSARKVVILGSGPNRIGQGVEFDYSCVHAVRAAQDAGYEVILINCNPETVSTDHLVSDKLFIEPLNCEDVIDILKSENPDGVFVQFGGQSPLKLAKNILDAGFKILGTPQEVIDLAEDRHAFGGFISRYGYKVPAWATGSGFGECLAKAESIGYPLLVRPSYVLGGRAMKIVRSESELKSSLAEAIDASQGHPILLDKYLERAIEFDVDLVCDGQDVYIPAVMEHIEEAGIHSGDSTSIIPYLKAPLHLDSPIRELCKGLALNLGVRGLLNVQLAYHEGELYVLEVNPRSSRSVPFVSKATAVPLAWLGARVALGAKLSDLLKTTNFTATTAPKYAVKAPVFPFHKFPGVSPNLGPEMRSIGEVMGTAPTAGEALAKAYIAAGWKLVPQGDILVLAESAQLEQMAEALGVMVHKLGCRVYCIEDCRQALAGLKTSLIELRQDDQVRSFALTAMRSGRMTMVISAGTQMSRKWRQLAAEIGALTTQCAVPFIESEFALDAWVMALRSRAGKEIQ
ncbi:MAG: carbamoyl-phosphate synthase large subunit [Proteobacteria bacterium]|nr:carbamoyl-phosphate synthase large subunit [Pseudomonadota bacterium]